MITDRLNQFFEPDELVPQELRPKFEKVVIDPLKREKRNEQITVQRTIPAKIEEVQAQIDELLPKQAKAQAALIKAEQALAAAQNGVKAATIEQDGIKWTIFELRARIDT